MKRIRLFTILLSALLLLAGIVLGALFYFGSREPLYYRDFKAGKPYATIMDLDTTVIKDPHDVPAWLFYGYHVSFNMPLLEDDEQAKEKFRYAGRRVYLRGIKANPDNSELRFNLALYYNSLEGNYRKAAAVLAPFADPNSSARFSSYQPAFWETWKRKNASGNKQINARILSFLSVMYKRCGIVTGDWQYFERAMVMLNRCYQLDPANNYVLEDCKELQAHMHDQRWLKEQQQKEIALRKSNKWPLIAPSKFNRPLNEIFPDGTTGMEDLNSIDDTHE